MVPAIPARRGALPRAHPQDAGGLETDLSARVLGSDGQPLSGVFAAGEAAGFGGGGVHGYRALEGTFPRWLPVPGRIAGRAAAAGRYVTRWPQ